MVSCLLCLVLGEGEEGEGEEGVTTEPPPAAEEEPTEVSLRLK